MARIFVYSICSIAELMILGDVETADIDGRDAKVTRTVGVAYCAVRGNDC